MSHFMLTVATAHLLLRIPVFKHDMTGSAVAVERIFLGGRDTISLRRESPQPNTIRILLILK